MSFPDFLCIGAQKSGTTWLDTHLRTHPDLWLPPAKELHYFDREMSPYVMMLFDRDPIQRSLVLNRFKLALRDVYLRLLTPPSCLYTIGWYARFMLMPRSDEWYSTLFAPQRGQIAGEVTPGYALMPKEDVVRICQLMPHLKMIYLLRNPVDRVWSQATMRFSRYGNHGLDAVAHDTIRQFLSRPTPIRHSRYLETLTVWETFLATDQVFIGFFEQIADDPRQLLIDLYRFLDITVSESYISPHVQKKVFDNKRPSPMPNDLRREVTVRLYPEIVALHKRFDNQYTESWLIQAEDVLSKQQTDITQP